MSRRPTFVYIGGSQPQFRALESLRAMGLTIVLVDRDPLPSSRELSDHVIVADATATQTIIDHLRALQDDLEILAVYGIADYAAASVAAIADRFGAAGPVGLQADNFTDKLQTSRLLSDAGLPVPHVYWSGPSEHAAAGISAVDQIPESVVVKVTSGNNSTGVRLCTSGDRLSPVSAARDFAVRFPEADLIVEEYVAGEIGNVDFLMLDGVCIPVSSTIRRPDMTDATLSSQLEQPNPHLGTLAGAGATRLADLGERIARALGYRSGPFTIDVIHGQDGKLRILEVSPHFHCLSLDIERGNGNPICAYAEWLRGGPEWKRFLPPEQGALPGILMQIFSSRRGRVVEIEGEDQVRQMKGLCDLALLTGPGQTLRAQGALERSAIALAWIVDRDRAALQTSAERIEYALDVTVEACA
jgi:carbamoylphosphate synthase large subunit